MFPSLRWKKFRYLMKQQKQRYGERVFVSVASVLRRISRMAVAVKYVKKPLFRRESSQTNYRVNRKLGSSIKPPNSFKQCFIALFRSQRSGGHNIQPKKENLKLLIPCRMNTAISLICLIRSIEKLMCNRSIFRR